MCAKANFFRCHYDKFETVLKLWRSFVVACAVRIFTSFICAFLQIILCVNVKYFNRMENGTQKDTNRCKLFCYFCTSHGKCGSNRSNNGYFYIFNLIVCCRNLRGSSRKKEKVRDRQIDRDRRQSEWVRVPKKPWTIH